MIRPVFFEYLNGFSSATPTAAPEREHPTSRASSPLKLSMAPSPKYQAGKLSYSRLLLLALLCLAGTACSTTAPIEKILFEDPHETVFLKTIPDGSFYATHPLTLEPALLAQLLKGIEVQNQEVGVQRLLDGPLAPVPAFSEEQIQFLAPLLAEGLRTATPNESIEYRVVSTHDGANRFQSPTTETTTGSLFAYDRQLYVILSQYRSNPMRTNLKKGDIAYRTKEPFDYSGLKYRTLRFTPKAALRPVSPNPPTMGKSTDRFVAVDYRLLDQATHAAEAQVRSTEALVQEVDTLKQELESIKKLLGIQNPGQDSPKQRSAPLFK